MNYRGQAQRDALICIDKSNMSKQSDYIARKISAAISIDKKIKKDDELR